MRNHLGPLVAGSLVALAALLWPALYNTEPFFFFDTPTYLRGADAGLQKLTGVSTPWTKLSDEPGSAPASRDAAAPDSAGMTEATGATAPGAEAPPSISSVKSKTILSGRSVYYGALLYAGDRAGHLWLTVIVQGALLLLSMGLFLRAFGLAQWPTLPIVAVVMGLLTSASFYVSFLMPDMFAAVTLLACATLIGARGLRPVEYGLWTALLAFSLACHSSHVLIAGAFLVVALIIDLARRSWSNVRGLAVIGVCLLIAGAAEAAFGMAVTRLVGAPPLRPPFLMARAIEDGPGYAYLRDTCPGNGFKVCEFLPRLPMSAEQFIWSRDPPGIFPLVSADVRRQLSAEQLRFVVAVFRHDPAALIRASSGDVLRQFTLMSLPEFNSTNHFEHDSFTAKIPPNYRGPFRESAAYRGVMPVGAAFMVQLVVFIAAATGLLLLLVWPRLRHRLDSRQLGMVGLVILGIALNGSICGMLSGPHERYEARVAWLVPFAALAVVFVLVRRTGRGGTAP